VTTTCVAGAEQGAERHTLRAGGPSSTIAVENQPAGQRGPRDGWGGGIRMTKLRHLTVRMAWHDAGWDGTVCRNPNANSYCTGSHSLLSDRLARNKNAEIEAAHAGKPLDTAMPDYLPPCYWTSAAFAKSPLKVMHQHPFPGLEDKVIKGKLPANTSLTWPFRLTMTHSDKARKKQGKYFADLEGRVDRFMGRLAPDESIVFFYLNYDNPVSAEEYRYTLVGCAPLKEVDTTGKYKFDAAKLAKIRSGGDMQNFPTLNWAMSVSTHFAKRGVRLPYQEYLALIEADPKAESKLDEIRVLIQEPALVPGFKYVSEQLDEDQCLALLYKLRRAFEAVERHGVVKTGNELHRLDAMIEATWRRRGLYPGLAAVVDQLIHLSDGDAGIELSGGTTLVESVRSKLKPKEDLLTRMLTLLNGTSVPKGIALPRFLGQRQ